MASSDGLHVTLDVRPALDTLRGFSGDVMKNAWTRALRKTSRWIMTSVARDLSATTQIPLAVIRKRLHFYPHSREQGKVWLGINPIEVERLGTPRQTETGVTVGGLYFPGAWKSGRKVFRRAGHDRLPFERVRFDWSASSEAAFRRAVKAAEIRLRAILLQEVNYELSKLTHA
jgi:hypothetical protein